MVMKFVNLGLAAGLIALLMLPTSADAQRKRSNSTAPAPSAQDTTLQKMDKERRTAAQALAPWHFKTPFLGQFRPANTRAIIAEEVFALSELGWVSISNSLTDRMGTFPNYTAFLGITADGRLEGVLFPSASSKLFGEEKTSSRLNSVSSLEIEMATGERASMQLSDVKYAEFDQTFRGKTTKEKLWFKTFTPGGKAWRMLGALPEESELTLHHSTAEGPGQLKYRTMSDEEPTIFTVGYLKEMMTSIRARSAAE